ncbi:hypothetical protein [Paramagnetospirillum magneticum]|uniref:Uncharacterized protein n=1 Tax=Paramagnetospirillum magneticum (strain ATCC 700264 / AMB-1) TaxID=342108 RepID=Q2W6G4_PARM1|nr:hypothetical protein [Paramagnetospirillum magneticum]BAE50561.1 hypothetical protein amb1757 [Paramagnetospirillum magneticum AMB-1]
MIGRLAAFLGFPSAALLGWSIIAALALAAAGSVATGIMVHRYDSALHGQAVAGLRADAAQTLSDQTEIVLRLMQDQIDRYTKLENDYARLSQDSARAQAESVRLSGDLDAARDRLLALAGADRRGGGGADGKADAGAGGCAQLRAALGRALDAVELLKSGGDEAASIGQHAVDVATIAARAAQDAARAPNSGHE